MGRVPEERCNASFSVLLLRKQVLVFMFLKEKKMEGREVIQRKIEDLE